MFKNQQRRILGKRNGNFHNIYFTPLALLLLLRLLLLLKLQRASVSVVKEQETGEEKALEERRNEV